MAGFDSLDPLRDSLLGYRAEVMQADVASYNGFEFPPCLHSQITVVPEYNESGTSLKYLTIAISVEFIATDSRRGVPEYSGSPEEDELERSGRRTGMDTFIDSLVKRLTYPGQALKFNARGFGEFEINTSNGIKDVDFGPKPQVVEWEPIGGAQAAKVQWLCVTRIPHDLSHSYEGRLISFEYGVQWGIDSAGFMFRSIEGSAEVPLTRQTQLGLEHSSHVFPFPYTEFKAVQEKVIKAWPHPTNARRQYFWRWDKSHKKIQFKIEDIEIRSDSPYLPGIVDIDLSQNVTSSMDEGGFYKWRLVYTGRIECANPSNDKNVGISDSKKIAWTWLGRIIQQKRKLFEQHAKSAVIPANPTEAEKTMFGTQVTPPSASQADPNYTTENLGVMIYPVYISITDEMYSNSISFTIGYIAIITTDLLTQSLGMFETIQLDQLNKDSWVKYLEEIDAHKLGTKDVLSPPSSELIVDLCHPVTANTGDKPKTTKKKSSRKTEPLLYVSAPEKNKDWKTYENQFYFSVDTHNVIGKKLHDGTSITTDLWPKDQTLDGETVDGAIKTRGEMSNIPDDAAQQYPTFSSGNPDPDKLLTVYSPTPHTIYVKMVGYAERFNGKINTPKLVGIGGGIKINTQTNKAYIEDNALGGALAHKYGQDMIERGTKNTGLRDSEGKMVVLHWARWEKTYVLDRVPADGRLITTGVPKRFENNFKKGA
jgi:hypothetical protein